MADIRTKLILDNRDFNRGIDESEKRTDRFNGALKRVGGIALTAAKAIGAAGLAIQGLAIRQANLGAQLTDTANKLNVNVRFLQQFRFAAEQTGVASTTADMALQRFTRRVAEAAQGTGEARQALAQMGIQLRNNDGTLRTSESLIMDVADAMSRSKDSTDLVRQSFKLFDSEGVALVNTLKGGSAALEEYFRQANRLGLLTTEQAQELKELDDSYTTLRLAVKGVVDEFVLGLAPVIGTLNEDMTELIANNRELARSLGEQTGQALLTFSKGVILVAENMDVIRNSVVAFVATGVLVKLGRNLKTLSVFFTALTAALQTGLGSAMSMLAGKTASLGMAFLRLLGPIGVITTIVAGLTLWYKKNRETAVQLGDTTSSYGEIVEAVTWKIGQFVETLKGFGPQLQRAFEEALGFAQFALEGILIAIKFLVNTAIGSFLLLPNTLSLAFDQMRRIVAGESVDFGAEWLSMLTDLVNTDYLGEATEVIKGYLGDIVEEFRKGREEVNEGEPLRIPIETDQVLTRWQQFVENLKMEFGFFVEGVKLGFTDFQSTILSTTQLGQQVFKRFAEGMTESITNFVMTGKMSMKGFLRDILRMIVQSGIQKALAGIFSAFGGTTLGKFLGGFAGGKMLGGMIPAGQFGLVGERGPEFIKGPAQITPVRQSDTQQQGGTTQIINISAVDTQSFRQALARQNPEFLYALTQTGARRLPR